MTWFISKPTSAEDSDTPQLRIVHNLAWGTSAKVEVDPV